MAVGISIVKQSQFFKFKSISVALARQFRFNMADLNAASRFEKSLGLLTTRFVNLLQEARDGVLDLKVVSKIGKIFFSGSNLTVVFACRPQIPWPSDRNDEFTTSQMFLKELG